MKATRRPNVVAYLSSQPLFKDLPSPALARIAAAATLKRLVRGEELFQAGQPCDGLYFVMDGQVKLYAKSAMGQEKVIEVVGPGEAVSEALVFSDGAHSVHASILADALLLMLPRDILVKEIERDTGLAMRMLAGLSRRLVGMVRDIEAVTLHSGVKRVVDYLLHSPVVEGGRHDGHDVTVSLPASKGTIASLLSVTPEHFSRILHDLQAQGLIAVERRHIRILDAQALARVS
jgi:CRP-like cAMP-binding protein